MRNPPTISYSTSGTAIFFRCECQSTRLFFFFNDPATTAIYTTANTLSLHDALPISRRRRIRAHRAQVVLLGSDEQNHLRSEEHTSELQSLAVISYAVFCLKKKK